MTLRHMATQGAATVAASAARRALDFGGPTAGGETADTTAAAYALSKADSADEMSIDFEDEQQDKVIAVQPHASRVALVAAPLHHRAHWIGAMVATPWLLAADPETS